ncbi:unnamed protein product [Acanthoscelides obtectus]|uniref:Uncharacterized protein n=1 Tax=Acanthoscelides obtectus TaxID=200917 RepID=A0A9P0M712_ACAOB|nr:unnamed protein product [Acanthoscelides obtectus]CAK1641156.1 hypothetical protein AOBTE_LOCUS12197 [Acanthoscelides obtectus]
MPNSVPANETQQNLNSPTNSEPANNENLELTVSQNSNTLSQSQRTSKKRKKEDEALDRALSVLDKSDDAAIFGDFVAAAIRNMRSESRKREIKRKIQRIILDMEELDEADQYSRPSTSQSLGPLTPLPNVTWESSEDTTYEHLY